MNNNAIIDQVQQKHHSFFGLNQKPLIIFSPGRINLIGEHTDYNNGFVMPGAIDKGIYMTISKSEGQSRVVSLDMDDSHTFSLHEPLMPLHGGGWKNYILGVIQQLKNAGHKLEEVNIVFGGDIPIGAGLSSSAALENAVGCGLNELFGLGIPKSELAKHSQMAEHEFAGVKCGIMDQYASMMGVADAAILLDCQSLDYERVPIALDDYALLLCNSNVEHNLASSEYNVRREQCEAGVSLLHQYYPTVKSLRDVTKEMLSSHQSEFDPIVHKRCAYIVEENERVQAFAQSLKQKDFEKAGLILLQAHEGMRCKYEISCDEIDFMVDFAASHEAVIGTRMMGGGFGGCTINLIRRELQSAFVTSLSQAYKARFGIAMTPIAVEIGNGTQAITSR